MRILSSETPPSFCSQLHSTASHSPQSCLRPCTAPSQIQLKEKNLPGFRLHPTISRSLTIADKPLQVPFSYCCKLTDLAMRRYDVVFGNKGRPLSIFLCFHILLLVIIREVCHHTKSCYTCSCSLACKHGAALLPKLWIWWSPRALFCTPWVPCIESLWDKIMILS